MDNHLLQLPLGGCSLHDLLVDGVGRDEPVDHDGLGLADPVAPVLSLQVLLGVPVAVVDDAGVGRGEIDAQAASPDVTLELKAEGVNCDVLPGAQQEDAVRGILVEPVDVGLSIQEVHPSV